MAKYVLIIFVDIRGFTSWSENQNVNAYILSLISKFYTILERKFQNKTMLKKLGDGAMIITEVSPEESSTENYFDNIYNLIKDVDKEFENECISFQKTYGQTTDLKLGWGVFRGTATPTHDSDDFLGASINRTARLCSVARPYGIVIENGNFVLSNSTKKQFEEEAFSLKGIDREVNCLVTKSISRDYVMREIKRETPEVHIAGICYRENNGTIEVLLAKRNKTRKLFPELFEGCGGQLKANESFENGVIRHFYSEMNITVSVDSRQPIIYKIDNDGKIINGLFYKCKFIEGSPSSENHSEVRFYPLESVLKMDEKLFIPGLQREIEELFQKTGE